MSTAESDDGEAGFWAKVSRSIASVDEKILTWAVKPDLAWSLKVVFGILVGLGLLSWLLPIDLDNRILGVEFAGSEKQFDAVLAEGSLEESDVRLAVAWDLVFIVAYALGLRLVCSIGAGNLWGGDLSRLARAAAVAAIVAAGFDLIENVALFTGTWNVGGDLPFQVAAGSALVKFVALALPLGVAAGVAGSLVARGIGKKWRRPSLPSQDLDGAGVAEGSGEQAWTRNYVLPAGHVRKTSTDSDGKAEDRVGVCLSGGGIRSGVFAMGVMQTLTTAASSDEGKSGTGLLDGVSFLATVSGGGYFGGALQMLRYRGAAQKVAEDTGPATDAKPGSEEGGAVCGPPIPLSEAFAAGSPEVDYVRRHGKYVAEGPGQWVSALVTVLRSVLFGMSLIYGTLLVGAWIMASLYAAARAFAEQLFPNAIEAQNELVPPSFDLGVWIAIVLPLVIAGILWISAGWGEVSARHRRFEFAAGFLALTGIVVVVLLAFPALVWGLRSLTASTDEAGRLVEVGTITALAAVATMLWNMLGKQPGADKTVDVGKFKAALANAVFATRFLTTIAVLIALIALGAVVFGVELSQALTSRFAGTWDGLVAAVVAAVIIAVLFAVFDQTRMSLHPFYKRRLATAFAIRRDAGGAEQIEYNQVTKLSQYGAPLNSEGMPDDEGMRLIVCAAAHTSGQRLGVPGRRVVPFVFSSDAVGSPQLGYLNTSALEAATAGTSYNTDITQTAAVALSGAAFASAMGNHSGPFDKVLALTNARLGAWLPNPHYHRKRQKGELPPLEDTRTALPRIRSLQYFAKEVVGAYSPDDRFVYVTDGGHYENLGLVELLRRRCTLIYCVDASGDSSLASTLAQAAGLAYEELGVEISIDGEKLAVNSTEEGKQPDETLRRLQHRFAATNVVRGTFTYPTEAPDYPGKGQTGRECTLIVGKSRLTAPSPQKSIAGTDEVTVSANAAAPATANGVYAAIATATAPGPVPAAGAEMDASEVASQYPLLTYAADHPEFPNDPTADQWFDAGQFQAYLTLGRSVGEEMAKESHRVQSVTHQGNTDC